MSYHLLNVIDKPLKDENLSNIIEMSSLNQRWQLQSNYLPMQSIDVTFPGSSN